MAQTKSNYGPLSNIFDELFGNQNFPNWNRSASAFMPMVNVGEADKNYFIEIVAPGLQKSDFTVNIEEGLLTVAYDHKTETENAENKKYHRKDFSQVSFKRTFNVEKNIDFDKIEAVYENGILKITLPKKEEDKPASKNVEIK